MSETKTGKRHLTDLFIILGFAVFALIYCYPALSGKIITQHDTISWRGMAREAMDWHKETGENTLWSNSMFGGMPTFLMYVPENHNYILRIQEAIAAVLVKPAYFLFLAMLGMFLLLRTLRVEKFISAAGALAYAFSTYNVVIIVAGHDSKMLSMAYIPMVIAGLLLLFRGSYLRGTLLYLLSFALIVSNGHYQMIFYMLIIMAGMGVYFLADAVRTGDFRRFAIASGLSIGLGLLSVGPNLASMMAVTEYSKQTMRGGQSELTGHDAGKKSGGLDKEYAFRWSNGIGETMSGMIPYLYGGSSGEPADKATRFSELTGGANENLPMYWGPQPFLSGPVYFGAIVCFLFLLGMMILPGRLKWYLAAVAFIGMVLAWGSNLPSVNNFLFDHLPFYNKFRTPSMAMIIPQIILPMVGFWGLMEIVRHEHDRADLLRKLKIAAGITVGICLIVAVAGDMFLDYRSATVDANFGDNKAALDAILGDRSALARKSAAICAVLIAAAAGLVWAYITDKVKTHVFAGGILVLVAFDMLPVAANYLNGSKYSEEDEYQSYSQPRPVDQQILQDKDPYYRVLDLTKDPYNDASSANFHKLVGGYSPAKLEIYQDLIDRQLGSKFNVSVLRMLNTKYLIFQPQGAPQPVAQPLPDPCGNAWFVDNIKWAGTADDEMNSLNGPALGQPDSTGGGFDPKRTAVIRESFRGQLNGVAPSADPTASIKLRKYGLNELSFDAQTSRPQLAVFSDVYYNYGWKAFIDGKETPIVRADYVLRALPVPAGKHLIEFRFHPDSYYTGDKFAIISSLLILGICVTLIVTLLRKRHVDEAVR